MDEKIKAAQEEADKTGFVLSGQDLFGRYARIAYGLARYGREPGVQDYHIYKVIQNFRSNTYCDVPLTYQTENNCYVHDEVVDVVNVIHCGIDESRVIRVALKDIDLLPAADVKPVVRGKWEWDPNGMDWGLGAWRCGVCKVKAETWWANDRKYNPMRCSGGRFCGNCGAEMVTGCNQLEEDEG